MKTVDEYLELPYKFEIVQESDGSFFIAVKELEGCMSAADTIEEAFVMIKDAMKAWISIALEDGKEIPEPEVLSPKKEYSGKFVIRTPKNLHKELAEKAEENNVSLNTYAISLLSRRCGIIEMKDSEIIILKSLLLGEEKKYTSDGFTQFQYDTPDEKVIQGDFTAKPIIESEESREK